MRIRLLIFAVICYFSGVVLVDAGSFSVIPSNTSVNAGTSYTVKINYSGETLGSAKFNITFSNVDCTGNANYSTITSKCTAASCEVALGYNANGYVGGSTLYTLSCTSNNTGTSKFNVALDNGDAWDVEGENEVSVTSASASVKVTATTTTTTTTTTKKITTTTTRMNTTTTTQKVTTTTKSVTTTTQPVYITTTSPTEVPTTNVVEDITTDDVVDNQETTTTVSTTVESEETTIVVPDDLKLKELKIVGYPIDFVPNLVNYKIKVSKDVNEIYVIAQAVDETTKVDNVGIVDISNKDFFLVKVYNEQTSNFIEYKINIEREENVVNSFNSIYIIVFFIFFIVIVLLWSFFKRNRVKLDRVDNVIIEPIVPSNVSNNNVVDDGIIDIPENEDELTIVFNNLNNK